MLHELARNLDEIDALVTLLADQLLIVTGSTGQPKAHPLRAKLREHRKLGERLAAALTLPVGAETIGRWRSPQQRATVNMRWHRLRTRHRLIRTTAISDIRVLGGTETTAPRFTMGIRCSGGGRGRGR